ncbi:InlB B-repeat-containing protein, partial [Listeria welshimeri]|uniref:InlB B-repeat-containing protein n=1 Tax=Listeria welshimeri TaxID=1643 RepID=UPI00396F7093
GYTFTGWYDAPTDGTKWDFETDKMPANDMTLYAQFSKNSSDDGTGKGGTPGNPTGTNPEPTDKNPSNPPQGDDGNRVFSLKVNKLIDNKEKTVNEKHLTLPATGDNHSLTNYLQVIGSFLLLAFFCLTITTEISQISCKKATNHLFQLYFNIDKGYILILKRVFICFW